MWEVTFSRTRIGQLTTFFINVSRVKSFPLNQNKLQNNSGGKTQRAVHYRLIDTNEWNQVAKKKINKKISIMKRPHLSTCCLEGKQ